MNMYVILNVYYKTHRKLTRCYLNGIVKPISTIGIGIITEYVVSKVLSDCIKCNTVDNFCAEYDLISKKYNTINVKSSKLYPNTKRRRGFWNFAKKYIAKIPNYYICIGFNEDKTEILHVWIIPGNSTLVRNSGIKISNSDIGLSRVIKYEVDITPYNEVYQNLDIYSLPEFCNFKQNNINDESYDLEMY
jgi:hypothetical protein